MFILFFTFSLVASGILVNKLLLQTFSPILFIGVRMLSSGLILIACTWSNHKEHYYRFKDDWILISKIAFLTVLIPALLKAFALTRLDAAQTTLIGSIDPFITALYAYFLRSERLSLTKFIGMTIGFLSIVYSLDLSHLTIHLSSYLFLWPQLAIFAAVACSRWGWLMVQIQLQSNRYPPAQLNGMVMTESGIVALIAAFFIEPVAVDPFLSLPQLSLLAYTVLAGNVIAYTLYGRLLKKHNATLLSLVGVSMPMFVGLYSWLLLGTVITLKFVLAVATFFIGLALFYYDDLKANNTLNAKLVRTKPEVA